MDALRRQTSAETAQTSATGVYHDKTAAVQAPASDNRTKQPETAISTTTPNSGDVVLELVGLS